MTFPTSHRESCAALRLWGCHTRFSRHITVPSGIVHLLHSDSAASPLYAMAYKI